METIAESIKVKPEEIHRLNGEYTIVLRGRVVALKSLAELLARPEEGACWQTGYGSILQTDRTGLVPIVVINVGGTQYGLIVDELKNQQDIVVKPLAGYLAQLPGLGGATILGNGNVVLVLDTLKLFQLAVIDPDRRGKATADHLEATACLCA